MIKWDADDLLIFLVDYRPTNGDDGVACKHGPEECKWEEIFPVLHFGKQTDVSRVETDIDDRFVLLGLGNIIELCAQKLYPDPKIFLGFTMCLAKNYHEIPQRSLIEDCALEYAIDFDQLNQCATKDDGALGIGLLRDSVKRSADVRLVPSSRFTVTQITPPHGIIVVSNTLPPSSPGRRNQELHRPP